MPVPRLALFPLGFSDAKARIQGLGVLQEQWAARYYDSQTSVSFPGALRHPRRSPASIAESATCLPPRPFVCREGRVGALPGGVHGHVGDGRPGRPRPPRRVPLLEGRRPRGPLRVARGPGGDRRGAQGVAQAHPVPPPGAHSPLPLTNLPTLLPTYQVPPQPAVACSCSHANSSPPSPQGNPEHAADPASPWIEVKPGHGSRVQEWRPDGQVPGAGAVAAVPDAEFRARQARGRGGKGPASFRARPCVRSSRDWLFAGCLGVALQQLLFALPLSCTGGVARGPHHAQGRAHRSDRGGGCGEQRRPHRQEHA